METIDILGCAMLQIASFVIALAMFAYDNIMAINYSGRHLLYTEDELLVIAFKELSFKQYAIAICPVVNTLAIAYRIIKTIS